jgi:sterol desaturase/sphingolipid hydroxylase (fatty acid hydroxylase superfamily)
MNDFILNHEPAIRLACFFGVVTVMAVWELLAPRRRLSQPKTQRWLNNLGPVVFNTALLRLVFPLAAAGMAATAELNGWGLFNRVEAPGWLALLASVVILDGAIYLQHVMFHAVPLFWRLHRVHHSHLDHETNSNFGFNLSIWDRLSGTYRNQPEDRHEGMLIGIDTFRDATHCVTLRGMLGMPLIGRLGDYAINRRYRDRQAKRRDQ